MVQIRTWRAPDRLDRVRSLHGSKGARRVSTTETSLGEKFARSLLAKDWDGTRHVLDPDVDFKALTPGRPWEATSAQETIDTVFTEWFDTTDDVYEILDISGDLVMDRHRVTYRFRVRNPDGDYVCEQTAYYDETEGRISTLRILCSGMLPSGRSLATSGK